MNIKTGKVKRNQQTSRFEDAGEIVAMIEVFVRPPKESCRRRVNLLSLQTSIVHKWNKNCNSFYDLYSVSDTRCLNYKNRHHSTEANIPLLLQLLFHYLFFWWILSMTTALATSCIFKANHSSWHQHHNREVFSVDNVLQIHANLPSNHRICSKHALAEVISFSKASTNAKHQEDQ